MTSQPRVRTLWLAGFLHAFTHLYQMALVPLYLLMRDDFHLASEGEATLLVTVMGIAYFLPSYPLGMLADRMSRKKLLAFGLVVNALGFAALAFAHSYAGALVCVAIAGFGGSFYHPAATALIARAYPNRTGKALGLVAIGASLGYFISPIYTGWRSEMTGNWRAPVLELGIFGMIFAGLFYWLADDDHRPVMVSNVRAATPKMFPNRTLWVFFIVACFFFSLRDFAGSAMSSLGSLFVQQAHGMNTKATGFILSGIFLSSAVSNPIFGQLSDQGRIRWTVLLLVLATVMVIIFPHVPKNWTFAVFMVYGFFFLASYPVVEAALMESVPDEVRGRVFGLFMTMAGMLGTTAHWIMGALVQKLGPDAASPRAYYPLYNGLAGLILLTLLGLPCLHAIRKREALEPQASVQPLVDKQSAAALK